MWIKRAVALGLCLALAGLCVWQIFQVDTGMQYIVLAPAEPERDPEKPAATALSGLVDKLKLSAEDWGGILSDWALTSQNEEVQLTGKNGQGASARLVGVYGSLSALPRRLARFGRNFYPEELKNGDRVILLDEELAIALFRTGDPVDRVVILNDLEYRVIGILRHGRTPGEHDAYAAYVPLLSLEKEAFQTETLMVSARPVPGAGAASQFKSDMSAWRAGGSLHLLSKERERALLPLRALIAAVGFCAALCLWRRLKTLTLFLYQDYRTRLNSLFAVQLLPRLMGYLLLVLLCAGGLLLLLYGLVMFTLEPVYVFPEWIPAVPVEWSDISSTFWTNRTTVTGAVELRSPELLTLRFYHSILTALCVLAGFILCKGYGYWRGRKEKNAA